MPNSPVEPTGLYAAFHVLLDVIVVIAIWRVPWPEVGGGGRV
ncbi:MAG: hypothetical protein ACRDKE_10175 [Solirubrobacterales bacterium]